VRAALCIVIFLHSQSGNCPLAWPGRFSPKTLPTKGIWGILPSEDDVFFDKKRKPRKKEKEAKRNKELKEKN
jgi:hypothetical protein